MKPRIAFLCLCTLLVAGTFFTGSVNAQTKAFRQADLASSIPGAANNTAANLSSPWAIAYLPGQSFFIADSGSSSINAQNSSGSQMAAVHIPSASGNMSAAMPTGLASDLSGAFKAAGTPLEYVAVTQNGTIAGFSVSNGETPAQATLIRDDSATGAVYTAVALLHPGSAAPFVAVADFNDASIHTYSSSFDPLDTSASFQDPNLPAGYAPYGLQVIANQVYVTYAVQNAAKNGPVTGAGNGIVNVFDLQGHFVRRLAMGGNLNAPWGVAQASANFGPFSGAILVGNVGDGTVSAFDPSTGNFLGQLRDGDGNLLVNPGIRALQFRNDGGADPNTLFFTAENSNGQGGLFGAIIPGLISVTRASVPAMASHTTATMTVTVAAGPGNSGTPTGTVSMSEGGAAKATAPVVDGVASIMIPMLGPVMRPIDVQYSGDGKFVPSSATVPAAGAGTFSVAASPTSVTVSPGQSAPVTVTVTPSGGFTGNVSLSCSTVPSVTCAFGSTSLAISSGSANTTMNINTTATTPGYGFLLPHGGMGVGLGGLLAVLALGGIMILRSGRFPRARVPVLATLGVLAALALSLGLEGCGSYNASQNSGPAMITIAAQSGSITQTTSVSLTVQ